MGKCGWSQSKELLTRPIVLRCVLSILRYVFCNGGDSGGLGGGSGSGIGSDQGIS